MIVLAWFTMMGLIILFGFGFVGATFVHWYRQGKRRRLAEQATTTVDMAPKTVKIT